MYGMLDPTDVLGRRVVAKIIDGLVGVPVVIFAIWWMFHTADHLPMADPVTYCQNYVEINKICFAWDDEAVIVSTSPLVSYGLGILTWLFMVILEGTMGWTPGKLIMGLRVVRQDNGQIPGFGKAFIRGVVWIVDGFCGGIVGFFVALRSPGHRRLGDQAASTLVVRKEAAGQPPVVPGLTMGPSSYLPNAYGGAQGTTSPWTPSTPVGPASGGMQDRSQFKADVPIWDEHRRAYIQYDTERAEWLEYDQAAAMWKPIST